MTDNIRTIADVEALAAKMGIALTPDDYAAAQTLGDQRREQVAREAEALAQNRSKTAAWVDQFNRWYPKFLQALHAAGDVLITATHTLIIAFGIPIVLLALLVVEQARVTNGLLLFDTAHSLAALGAWVLVVSNLSLELLISWREHQAGWQEPPRYEFSFRLVALRLRYLFGQQGDWQPTAKSPAMRFKSVLRAVTGCILALALAGSMLSALTSANGDWYAAIQHILVHGTLLEMVTWFGGLLYAYTIVRTAQALSHYVAERVVEIIAVMQSSVDDKDVRALEAAGLTAASALLARLKDKQRTRRMQTATASPLNMPQIIGGSVRVPTVPSVSETDWHSTTTGETGDPVPSVSTVPETVETLSPAVCKALAWLNEHPEAMQMSVRDAADLAGISSSTMQRARKALKSA